MSDVESGPDGAEPETLEVGGVTVYRLPEFIDPRGNLIPAELGRQLPFAPRRFFLVHDVSNRDARGEHAHRRLHQFLVCVAGECSLDVDDGRRRRELRLDRPTLGVHVAPWVWTVQRNFSADAVLLVLASEIYDPSDYIRDYEEFVRQSKVRPASV